jgi:hypothetical protein
MAEQSIRPARIDEIVDGIYRISTTVGLDGFGVDLALSSATIQTSR